jgi:hypothetical protein
MAKLTERALATLTQDERAALVGQLVQIRRNIAASAG